jgi:AcrR family transcriptional regulator
LNIVHFYEHIYYSAMTSDEIHRSARRKATHDHKRQAILTAARAVFERAGMAGATMRAIAEAAGYVPGAVYAYFPTKEAILGELLVQSLSHLNQTIKVAVARQADKPDACLAAAALALHDYYQASRAELELSLILVQGGAVLTPELERLINGRLIAVLQQIAGAICAATGIAPAEAEGEAVMLFAEVAGLLLLGATGRLHMLRQDSATLVNRAVQRALERFVP